MVLIPWILVSDLHRSWVTFELFWIISILPRGSHNGRIVIDILWLHGSIRWKKIKRLARIILLISLGGRNCQFIILQGTSSINVLGGTHLWGTTETYFSNNERTKLHRDVRGKIYLLKVRHNGGLPCAHFLSFVHLVSSLTCIFDVGGLENIMVGYTEPRSVVSTAWGWNTITS